MAAAVFAGDGLESLRRFPETGRELSRFFTLTPADSAFIDPGRAEVRRVGLGSPLRCARCRG